MLKALRAYPALALALLLGACSGSEPIVAAPTEDASSEEVAVDTGPLSPWSPVNSLQVLPGDGAGALVSAIDGAKMSVHVEVYLLLEDGIVNSLIAAKKRGVEVTVILEKNPFGGPGSNDAECALLTSNGVTCKWSNPRYTFTHAKFAVIDGAKAIMGSYNFVKSAFTTNRDYGVVTTDPTDVAEAQAIFKADLTGADGPASGRLVVSPRDARDKLRALFSDAKTSLDVEMEQLVDTEMTQRIAAAAKRGAKVRVVVPSGSLTSAMTASLDTLAMAGVAVRTLGSPDVHAKLILVDKTRAYIGSNNLSATSLDKNREVGLITDTADAVARASATFEADFAKATPR